MEIEINKAEKQIQKLIKLLQEKNEEVIYLCDNGIPIVQMTNVPKESKRIGIGKGKIKTLSVDELNSFDLGEIF